MRFLLEIVSVLLVISFVRGDDQEGPTTLPPREGKLAFGTVGAVSTTTLTTITTVTTSARTTCVSTAAAAVCGRRRRRALIKELTLSSDNDGEEGKLSGSSTSNIFGSEQIDARTGRNIIVWTTIWNTFQVTTTSAIPGVSITVSALCNNAGGTIIPQACALG